MSSNAYPVQTQPVLLVDLAKGYGGAEVRVFDTAQALHGRYPYAVATLAGSPLHQRLKAASLIALPIPYSRSDPRLLIFLQRAIRQGGYQTVDAHNVQSQFWGHLAALWAGAPNKISTVHSAYKLEHHGSLKGWLYEQVLRLNAIAGVQFVGVSTAVQSYLRQIGLQAERISLIPNSIILAPETGPKPNHPLIESLGWPKNSYIVIVVARLEPVKGHTYVLEAISQLAPLWPQLRCLIVGEGRTRPALEAQVTQANLQERVHFTGFRTDVAVLLKVCNAFCLPSLSEGLPYALLEACAQRLPLLVTNVGGMADLLSHQRTAYLVPPANAVALAHGLNWLLEQPQEATIMAQSAFESLQQRFNPAEMMAKTLALYQPNLRGQLNLGTT